MITTMYWLQRQLKLSAIDPPAMGPRLLIRQHQLIHSFSFSSHRARLLSKQILTQHPTPLMGEEHIEDAQLNDSLI